MPTARNRDNFIESFESGALAMPDSALKERNPGF